MMQTTQNKKYINTSNFDLATVFSMHSPIQQVLWNEAHTAASFGFLDTERLRDIENKFWKRELRLEPQAIFAFSRALKSRLYEEKGRA
jgi:hypothetical protein